MTSAIETYSWDEWFRAGKEAKMDGSDTSATMTFGQVLRQRRMELGLTQEALAERVGDNVRQADISRLERDYISIPRRSRLEALAQALEVSPGYLLMRSGWFNTDEEDMTSTSGEGMAESAPPQELASPVSDAQESPASHRVQSGETGASSQALHDAILRARELSEQTRDVLTKTANTIKLVGQTRFRED
jgi:transcriptional regulator with XRE-family HTH domain